MRSSPARFGIIWVLALAVVLSCVRGQGAGLAPTGNPSPPKGATNSPVADTESILLAAKPAQVPAPPPEIDSGPKGSSEVAAALASQRPRFVPNQPAQPETVRPADVRESDKPRNSIPRLPIEMLQRFVVRESRMEAFRERDLHTTSGLIDLSFKNHPGLHVGNVLSLNSGLAYEMYLEDERLQQMGDLEDIAHAMTLGGDPAEAKAILEAERDAYLRADDFGGPVGIH